MYEWTSANRGSISAEHGVGLMKANKICYSKSPPVVCALIIPLVLFYDISLTPAFLHSSGKANGLC